MMTNKTNATRGIITLLFMLMIPKSFAQCDSTRIYDRATMFGIGCVNILDTYLSPEEYTGTEIRFRTDISHNMRKFNGHLSQQTIIMGNLSTSKHHGDGNMMAGMFTFNYGLHYNWSLLENRLHLFAGGLLDTNIGFIYNTRNNNNPAQAKLSLNILPSAGARYNFRLNKHDASINYQINLPLVGIMFSPNYGQSYYEIFSQGNYDHNAVPTTFISTPSVRSYITFDYSFHKTTLRIGYLADFQQSKVNNLKSHIWSNVIMIGFVKRFKMMNVK
jgi:hypothetical protein